MDQDDDIGTAYAAERLAAEDAALVAEFDSQQTTSGNGPSAGSASPPTTIEAQAAMEAAGGDTPANLGAATALRNFREIPLQFLFGGAEGAARFAETAMQSLPTALPAAAVATGDPGPAGRTLGMEAAPTPVLVGEEGIGRKPTTLMGGLSRGVGQFLPGYLAATKALQGLSTVSGLAPAAASSLKSMLAGAAAGTLDFDPAEPRISNFVQATGLANPLSGYLAADPADSKAEGLFKSAVENLGLGVATDGVMALARLSRARVAANRALAEAGTKTPEQLVDDAMRASSEVLDPVVDGPALGDPDRPLVEMRDGGGRFSTASERLTAAAGRAVDVRPADVAEAGGTAEDKRIAAMSVDEWIASRPKAEAGTEPTVESVLSMSGIDRSAKGPAGVSRVQIASDEAAYLFRDKDGSVVGALRGFLDKDGVPELVSVAVDPAHQKRSIGKQLLAAARRDFPGADAALVQDAAGLTEAGARLRYRNAVEATTSPPQKIFVNLARINTAEDVKAAISSLASRDSEAINAARGGEHQSFAEVERLAADIGMTSSDLLGRRRGPMGAAEAVAARKMLTSSGQQLAEWARKAGAPGATPVDLAGFQRATAVHYAIQTEVIAARTETARALASWRIPAGADGAMRLSDLHAALEAAGGPEKVADAARRLAMLADNPAAMSKAVEAGFRSTWGDVFKDVWFNGILSGPKTHARNMVGNSLTTAWAIPERMGTAAVSAFGSGDVQMGEASAMAWGALKGVRDAFRAAGRALRTGEGSDLFNKLEVGRPAAISYEAFGPSPSRTRVGNFAARGAQTALGHGLDAIGTAIDAPGRLLMSSDEFFKAINYRMELHAQAFRAAVGEGLSGDDLATRITDLTMDPTPAMQDAARQFARTQTFTSPLGGVGQTVTKFRGQVPGATFVLPFVRTPANITKYTFERTPLAFLSARIRGDLAAGGARREAALARMGLGSAAMLAAADMVANGELVGGGPGEPSMRAGRERQGIPQYAFKVGDQWVTYNGLDPFGMLLGMGADTAEIIGLAEGEDQDRSLAALGLLFVNAAASKTYLSGLFDFIDAIDSARDSAQPMAVFTQRMLSSAVPFSGFLNGLKAAGDPVQRETRTTASDPTTLFVQETLNRVKSRTPGWSETLPPRRDLWGRPVEYKGNLGVAYSMASPVQVSAEKPDAVDKAIVSNGIDVQMPQRSIQGVPLTGEEYSRYVQLAGEPAKLALDDIVASSDFAAMSDGPDGMKALVVKDAVSKFRQAATVQMLAEFPSLAFRVQAHSQARNQLLTEGANGTR